MINKTFKYIKYYSLAGIPSITLLLSFIINFINYEISNLSLLIPLIIPMVIYFWSIYQPENLPYGIILLVGLFKDIIEGNVIGLSAIYMLIFQASVRSQKNYMVKHNFIVVWVGFMFFLGVLLLMYFFSFWINNNVDSSMLYVILGQWLVSIFIYVPMHALLYKLNKLNIEKHL